jgi:hypothetical protein
VRAGLGCRLGDREWCGGWGTSSLVRRNARCEKCGGEVAVRWGVVAGGGGGGEPEDGRVLGYGSFPLRSVKQRGRGETGAVRGVGCAGASFVSAEGRRVLGMADRGRRDCGRLGCEVSRGRVLVYGSSAYLDPSSSLVVLSLCAFVLRRFPRRSSPPSSRGFPWAVVLVFRMPGAVLWV